MIKNMRPLFMSNSLIKHGLFREGFEKLEFVALYWNDFGGFGGLDYEYTVF